MVTKFRKKKKKSLRRNVFFSILFGALLLLIIGFLVVTNWKIKQRRAELTARIAFLKEEIAILEQKNQEIKDRISQTGEGEHLEKVARDQLGLKAPGEEVVVVQKEEEEQEEVEEEKETWWEKIKSIWKRD